MKEIFQDKIVLITGGLGSIGEELLKKLLDMDCRQIRVFDNRETELFYARQKYSSHENLRFLFGDVRDSKRLLRACEEADIIFHAAALKHVLLCEYDPFEAVKTNVLGTQNLIECAMATKVDKVILISTDKAANPFTVMGTTKLLAERLISSMLFNRGTSQTKFGAVRFGNVLGSRGSVLEIWNNQLGKGEKITVTDPEMTRFFMSVSDSVNLIFEAAKYVEDGETFIFKMKSVKIGDLAKAYLESKGKSPDDYGIIGKKLGEKTHEDLIFDSEATYLLENKHLLVRLPLVDKDSESYRNFLKKGFKPTKRESFSSEDKDLMLDVLDIKKILLN